MILGMSIATSTIVHVVVSLIGIVSGLIVLFGMFGSRRLPGWTALFLLTTILTSVTGFIPVSYTHLDVYKRQSPPRLRDCTITKL